MELYSMSRVGGLGSCCRSDVITWLRAERLSVGGEVTGVKMLLAAFAVRSRLERVLCLARRSPNIADLICSRRSSETRKRRPPLRARDMLKYVKKEKDGIGRAYTGV